MAAYLDGDATYTLARRYDIHRHTVVRHLRRRGIDIRANTAFVLDAAQTERALGLYADRMPLRQIAGELGVPERAVIRALDDTGVRRT